jgi:hypothetical protein
MSTFPPASQHRPHLACTAPKGRHTAPPRLCHPPLQRPSTRASNPRVVTGWPPHSPAHSSSPVGLSLTSMPPKTLAPAYKNPPKSSTLQPSTPIRGGEGRREETEEEHEEEVCRSCRWTSTSLRLYTYTDAAAQPVLTHRHIKTFAPEPDQ